MIRYHSFYPWHREGAYRHFMNADDEADLAAVRAFNRKSPISLLRYLPRSSFCSSFELLFSLGDMSADKIAYDLYSKSDDPPKVSELKDYYQGLISKYFPEEVEW